MTAALQEPQMQDNAGRVAQGKSANLNIRVSSDDLALFKRAAEAKGQSLSAFVLEAALGRARAAQTPDDAAQVEALVKNGEPVFLRDCPVGLFWANSGELCLKIEYGNNEGRINAYIVSSGEFFWGEHPQTIENQRTQVVQPVALDNDKEQRNG